MTMAAIPLKDSFTSTGAKFFFHQEAMRKLRDGRGMPITTHVMLTDKCNHSCAFCSVLTRAGDSLLMRDVDKYLDTLVGLGLKSVILSGGGNPILYLDRETKQGFDDAARRIADKGLELGLITNGAAMKEYSGGRRSWRTVAPETLDLFSWVRISMSGLDHAEDEVYVPDVDPQKTTLGFSYVYHDIYDAPDEPNHGKVSTRADFMNFQDAEDTRRLEPIIYGRDRLPRLTEQIAEYVARYRPRYVRLLPNCLEPTLIPQRCAELQKMADEIDPQVVFVQNKPPRAPHACFLGYVHPVLNSDGFVYPCDSVVLNEDAVHKFANPWRVCHMSEIAGLYERPVQSLLDPQKLCPGCVFSKSNDLLELVRDGTIDTIAPEVEPIHANFI